MKRLPDKDAKELLKHVLELKKLTLKNKATVSQLRNSMTPLMAAATKGSFGRIFEVIGVIAEFVASTIIMMAIVWVSSMGEKWVKHFDSTPQDNLAFIFFQYADMIAILFTCAYLLLAMVIYFYKSIKIKLLLADAEVKRVKKSMESNS